MLTSDFQAIERGNYQIRYKDMPSNEDNGLRWRGEVWIDGRYVYGRWFKDYSHIVAYMNTVFVTKDVQDG